MSISKFTDIITLSNKEIAEKIIKTENQLFNLRFKKATRQVFKSHEIKNSKRLLAQLKTLLTLRLKKPEGNEIKKHLRSFKCQ
jgi:large subunit ribosomal protein L29